MLNPFSDFSKSHLQFFSLRIRISNASGFSIFKASTKIDYSRPVPSEVYGLNGDFLNPRMYFIGKNELIPLEVEYLLADDGKLASYYTSKDIVVCFEIASPEKQNKTSSALDIQEGGSHYKNKKIQPIEYIYANNLDFLEGCIVKRITRWRDKENQSDPYIDLKKIKHEIDLLIQQEELKKKNG